MALPRKFTLTIQTTNDAFGSEHDPPESQRYDGEQQLARLIRDVGRRIDQGALTGTVMDVNGNTVGEFSWR